MTKLALNANEMHRSILKQVYFIPYTSRLNLLLMQTCQSLFWLGDSIFFPLWRLKNLQRLLETLLDYGSVNGK